MTLDCTGPAELPGRPGPCSPTRRRLAALDPVPGALGALAVGAHDRDRREAGAPVVGQGSSGGTPTVRCGSVTSRRSTPAAGGSRTAASNGVRERGVPTLTSAEPGRPCPPAVKSIRHRISLPCSAGRRLIPSLAWPPGQYFDPPPDDGARAPRASFASSWHRRPRLLRWPSLELWESASRGLRR